MCLRVCSEVGHQSTQCKRLAKFQPRSTAGSAATTRDRAKDAGGERDRKDGKTGGGAAPSGQKGEGAEGKKAARVAERIELPPTPEPSSNRRVESRTSASDAKDVCAVVHRSPLLKERLRLRSVDGGGDRFFPLKGGSDEPAAKRRVEPAAKRKVDEPPHGERAAAESDEHKANGVASAEAAKPASDGAVPYRLPPRLARKHKVMGASTAEAPSGDASARPVAAADSDKPCASLAEQSSPTMIISQHPLEIDGDRIGGGVYYNVSNKRWEATTRFRGAKKHLGSFASFEEGFACREKAIGDLVSKMRAGALEACVQTCM